MVYSQKIVLHYTPKTWDKPIVYRLVTDYSLVCNILKALVYPKRESVMVLELSGTEENYHRGIEYVESLGITVEPIEHDIERNETLCIHCGTCTAVCPTGALSVDRTTMEVTFSPDKCSACGLCIYTCPVRAMKSSF
jgi:ferredoxin